ncbi:Hypothetical predicted protein [Xyrichtys novacula]|uniref:Uncharacterized protein n=1 Tax=Xyrichtys novacula TaxID=13765 RepID=A0AAV1FNW6_XYRNO|nr:Hypothetical predicted protein [Xyrichtys novacula]
MSCSSIQTGKFLRVTVKLKSTSKKTLADPITCWTLSSCILGYSALPTLRDGSSSFWTPLTEVCTSTETCLWTPSDSTRCRGHHPRETGLHRDVDDPLLLQDPAEE